ncbi:restriction endonuclease [Methylocystis parvus]|nr:restriction endonuclease [Methylocystis parvus]WBK02376.1 restriction endonuclease [Methylocystis parvus OBBP]
MEETRASISWRQYQERAAAVFKRMGFDAAIEPCLDGARGRHEIDVLVRTSLGSIPILWIVECKDWKVPVSKAHVLTLYQIAQDLGADRAFLLCEAGFQAGAIAAVRQTNVTLASIGELEALVADAVAEATVKTVLATTKAIEHDLHSMLFELTPDAQTLLRNDETVELLGACLDISLSVTKALAKQFPLRCPQPLSSSEPKWADDLKTYADEVEREADLLAIKFQSVKSARIGAERSASRNAHEMLGKLDELLSLGETLARGVGDESAELVLLRTATGAMRSIGRKADDLRETPMKSVRNAARELVRELVDGLYLWLGAPGRTQDQWVKVRVGARTASARLSEAAKTSSIAWVYRPPEAN